MSELLERRSIVSAIAAGVIGCALTAGVSGCGSNGAGACPQGRCEPTLDAGRGDSSSGDAGTPPEVDASPGDSSSPDGAETGALDAGPFGYLPSNFDPNHLVVVDGGLPDGGYSFTSAPDVTITGSCGSVANPADAAAEAGADSGILTCLPAPVTIQLSDGALAWLFIVHDFTSIAASTLTLRQAPLPVIVAVLGTADIEGTIDVSADMDQAGPGGWSTSGPGKGSDCDVGGYAGGGSFCGTGGTGGDALYADAGPPPGGTAYGAATLIPLQAGSPGGACRGEWAGAGGGAFQISARTSIRLGPQGIVNAGGGGGQGGGGAGGAILLEAPTVTLRGAVTANGGGGGASDPGAGAGDNAMPSATPASGSQGVGGNGSAGDTVDGGNGNRWFPGPLVLTAGGGGAGRIRINTASGSADAAGSVVSPSLSPATTCSTQGTLVY